MATLGFDKDNRSPIISSVGTPVFKAEGSFVVGTTACLFFDFVDIDGVLFDPSDIDIAITDSLGALIKTGTALDKIEVGIFAFTWSIPKTGAVGKYTFVISYTAETTAGPSAETLSGAFIVSEKNQGALNMRQMTGRAFLESLIGEPQRLPVYNEIGRWNITRDEASFSFPRWNQSAGALVYLNGDLQDSGFVVDWFRGKILFTQPLTQYDEVTATYNFRWFEDNELDGFVEQGVNTYNIWPPQTTNTINSIEDRWIIAAEYSAAVMALRRFMFDILFQRPAKIFGGMDRADKIFGHMETLKKNYEDEANKLYEQKAKGPYVGLTRTVTVPEFTLPGGRSRWFRYLFKGAV